MNEDKEKIGEEKKKFLMDEFFTHRLFQRA